MSEPRTDEDSRDPVLEALELPTDQVKARALAALRQKRFDLAEQLLGQEEISARALVENQRIYQAELEIQNEELIRSQTVAQEALMRFTALFQGLPVAGLVIHREGLVEESNSAAQTLFNLKASQLRQHFFSRMIDTTDRGSVVGAWFKLKDHQEVTVEGIRFNDGTDEGFLGDLHIAPLPGAHGDLPQFVCVVLDRSAAIRLAKVGAWMLEAGCRQLVAWDAAGFAVFRLAVNLSVHQLKGRRLVERVREVLADTGVAAERLELEVTESTIMRHPERAVDALQKLRALGITLAIDDFDTGHSSLAYLKRLPLHRLKIHRSFVEHPTQDGNDDAIVRATIALSGSLGLETLAEGVETEVQASFLRQEGGLVAQGYLFGRPLATRGTGGGVGLRCVGRLLVGSGLENRHTLRGRGGSIRQPTTNECEDRYATNQRFPYLGAPSSGHVSRPLARMDGTHSVGGRSTARDRHRSGGGLH